MTKEVRASHILVETKDEAQKWMTNEGDGQLLAYQDLLTFNWGIHE